MRCGRNTCLRAEGVMALAGLLTLMTGCLGTLVGTVLGAGIGAIAGGSTGTAIGAGAGALSGALVGIYEDLRDDARHQRDRKIQVCAGEWDEGDKPRAIYEVDGDAYDEFLRWQREQARPQETDPEQPAQPDGDPWPG